MSESLVIRPLGDETEALALGAIEGWAFGFPPTDALTWFKNAGMENVRVALRGSRVCGGILLVPMGQWFGGQSVPLVGVAGVAVAPEERGRGVALGLMKSALSELAAAGGTLSGLYPATRTLYRAVGYELSGTRYQITLRPSDIGISERKLAVRSLTDDDFPKVQAAYAELARENDGYLDRGPYIWRRVRQPRGEPTPGWMVEGDDGLAGYVFVKQKTTSIGHYDLSLTDVLAKDVSAARRILSFLADHRSLATSVSWYGGPADPFAALLPEGAFEMKLGLHWMTRILSVKRALSARGYPSGLGATLDIALTDELLPENQGRFRLTVEAGRGEVTSGGSGSLAVGVHGLAALYTGFQSPFALRRMGLCQGDDAVLRQAAGLFQGPAPSMCDMY